MGQSFNLFAKKHKQRSAVSYYSPEKTTCLASSVKKKKKKLCTALASMHSFAVVHFTFSEQQLCRRAQLIFLFFCLFAVLFFFFLRRWRLRPLSRITTGLSTFPASSCNMSVRRCCIDPHSFRYRSIQRDVSYPRIQTGCNGHAIADALVVIMAWLFTSS